LGRPRRSSVVGAQYAPIGGRIAIRRYSIHARAGGLRGPSQRIYELVQRWCPVRLCGRRPTGPQPEKQESGCSFSTIALRELYRRHNRERAVWNRRRTALTCLCDTHVAGDRDDSAVRPGGPMLWKCLNWIAMLAFLAGAPLGAQHRGGGSRGGGHSSHPRAYSGSLRSHATHPPVQSPRSSQRPARPRGHVTQPCAPLPAPRPVTPTASTGAKRRRMTSCARRRILTAGRDMLWITSCRSPVAARTRRATCSGRRSRRRRRRTRSSGGAVVGHRSAPIGRS